MWYFVIENGVISGKTTAGGSGHLDATVYQESEVGSEPAWPRMHRNALLAASDWTQLPDVALTADQISQAKVYRTALRGLPASQSVATAVTWPTMPDFI